MIRLLRPTGDIMYVRHMFFGCCVSITFIFILPQHTRTHNFPHLSTFTRIQDPKLTSDKSSPESLFLAPPKPTISFKPRSKKLPTLLSSLSLKTAACPSVLSRKPPLLPTCSLPGVHTRHEFPPEIERERSQEARTLPRMQETLANSGRLHCKPLALPGR